MPAPFDSAVFDGRIFDIGSAFETATDPLTGWVQISGTGAWQMTTTPLNNWNTDNTADDGWTIHIGPEQNWS